MKILIVAEKPSAAADIAKALGKFKKSGSNYENDSFIISSAVGHLLELYKPDEIDKKLRWWTLQTLPIIPDSFQLKPIEKTKDRIEDLSKLFNRPDVNLIINACDAGREGELIFTYIYEFLNSKKPVKRMWMSSMTPAGLREAYQHLRDHQEMFPLRDAAKCRSESDWLIGINGTRAITTRMFGKAVKDVATVGRVQTPTLSIVYEREKAIQAFIPRTYWKITAEFNLASGSYTGIYQKPDFKKTSEKDEDDKADRIWDQPHLDSILNQLANAKNALVHDTKKRTKQSAPTLYDLTTLQREANNRFGFSAASTLKIAQSLYEKHKAITYPRTDSKALPEDYPAVCHKVLHKISEDYQPFASEIIHNNWIEPFNKRVFDNKKVSDHFAIIPTEEAPSKLSTEEAKIYDMITKRFLAVFYPAAEFDVTTRISSINDHSFKTEGKVLVHPGWQKVYGKDISKDEASLPPTTPQDGSPPNAQVLSINPSQEQTRPPARFTEATLLAAMEQAGKFVDDEELADAMKEKGLGTPATRASIIDHLIRENYLSREGRDLLPTTKAANLLEFLKAIKVDNITSPTMTGEWEFKLRLIEKGSLSRQEFMQGIQSVTRDLVNRAKEFNEDSSETTTTDIISPTDNLPLLENFRAFKSQSGDLTIYKTIGNRKLSHDELKTLLEKRQVGPLDGFVSKFGKPFSAILKMDDNYKISFDFGNSPSQDGSSDSNPAQPLDTSNLTPICSCPMTAKGLCNHPDAKVYATPQAYQCNYYGNGCKFRISRQLLSRTLPEDQIKKLAETGKTDLIDKFISNKTKRPFSAFLVLKDNGSVGFEFEPRKPKAPKPTKDSPSTDSSEPSPTPTKKSTRKKTTTEASTDDSPSSTTTTKKSTRSRKPKTAE